jgi:aspartate racemase
MANRLLGILGGMGPLASADFIAKLIAGTPARSDQDHVPFLLWSVPQIPDRNLALAGTGPSPLPAMLRGLHALRDAGCDLAVIPCNTAHNWHDDLARQAGLPLLHMADAACAGLGPGTVGLIGTRGTIASGIYQRRLAARGIDCLVPDADDVNDLVMPGIYQVKQGNLTPAAAGPAPVALRCRPG